MATHTPAVVLAGGGTGGHVYPALAIGDVLKRHGYRVLFYGDPSRLEGRVAPERGFELREVHTVAYPRKRPAALLGFVWRLLQATLRARSQLRSDQAACVLGVGGYIAVPTALAAFSLGIPVVIHEANVTPGLANRLLARFARKALLTWPATQSKLPSNLRTEVVGVPVNPALAQGDRMAAAVRYRLHHDEKTVLIVGGSLGAQRLNELAIAYARDPARKAQIVLIAGTKYHESVLRTFGIDRPPGFVVLAYEDRMADAYAMADLVVCRAGSSTLAELALAGKAALLVPSPHVTDNHQEANARSLEHDGAAEVVVESSWDIHAVLAKIEGLLADDAHRRALGERLHQASKPKAALSAAFAVESVMQAPSTAQRRGELG